MEVKDLENIGTSIIRRYTNEIDMQKEEIENFKKLIKEKDDLLKKQCNIIKEKDTEITNLKERNVFVDEGACKNCDFLRQSLEEFSDYIETNFGIEGFYKQLEEKNAQIQTYEKDLEETKLKLCSQRNENFMLRKEIRELKSRLAEDSGAAENTRAFPEEYMLSCRTALELAQQCLQTDDLNELKNSSQSLCGYFDQLLEHCMCCRRHESDSGIDDSDSEQQKKVKPCDKCNQLEKRYDKMRDVVDRLVSVLIIYEDITLMLKLSQPNVLLWGPGFEKVAKRLVDPNDHNPRLMEHFFKQWSELTMPEINRIKATAEKQVKDKIISDSSTDTATSPPSKKRRRIESAAAGSEKEGHDMECRMLGKEVETQTVDCLIYDKEANMKEKCPLRKYHPSQEEDCVLVFIARPKKNESPKCVVMRHDISGKPTSSSSPDAQSTTVDAPTGLSPLMPPPQMETTATPSVNIKSEPMETLSEQRDQVTVPPINSNGTVNRPSKGKNPYEIQPEVLQLIRETAPEIVEKVAMKVLEETQTVTQASSAMPTTLSRRSSTSPLELDRSLLPGRPASTGQVPNQHQQMNNIYLNETNARRHSAAAQNIPTSSTNPHSPHLQNILFDNIISPKQSLPLAHTGEVWQQMENLSPIHAERAMNLVHGILQLQPFQSPNDQVPVEQDHHRNDSDFLAEQEQHRRTLPNPTLPNPNPLQRQSQLPSQREQPRIRHPDHFQRALISSTQLRSSPVLQPPSAQMQPPPPYQQVTTQTQSPNYQQQPATQSQYQQEQEHATRTSVTFTSPLAQLSHVNNNIQNLAYQQQRSASNPQVGNGNVLKQQLQNVSSYQQQSDASANLLVASSYLQVQQQAQRQRAQQQRLQAQQQQHIQRLQAQQLQQIQRLQAQHQQPAQHPQPAQAQHQQPAQAQDQQPQAQDQQQQAQDQQQQAQQQLQAQRQQQAQRRQEAQRPSSENWSSNLHDLHQLYRAAAEPRHSQHGPVHWQAPTTSAATAPTVHSTGVYHPPPPPQTPSTVQKYQNIFNVQRE